MKPIGKDLFINKIVNIILVFIDTNIIIEPFFMLFTLNEQFLQGDTKQPNTEVDLISRWIFFVQIDTNCNRMYISIKFT